MWSLMPAASFECAESTDVNPTSRGDQTRHREVLHPQEVHHMRPTRPTKLTLYKLHKANVNEALRIEAAIDSLIEILVVEEVNRQIAELNRATTKAASTPSLTDPTSA